MELTKNSNTQIALSSLSQTTTAISLENNKFEEIEKSVGFSARELLEKPPIAMLKKVVDPEKIEMFLAIQITKLISQSNIANNLNIQNHQIPTIAAQLIESYPVESLEDFVLCFKRGSAGFYGTIYKLDASVLCEWMKAYLDEKYTYVEGKVKEEQEAHIEENKINYDRFKERVGDFIKAEKQTNFKENEYQKQRLENPYKYYDVRGLQIYATSQEHAEKLVERLIELGEVEEYETSNNPR